MMNYYISSQYPSIIIILIEYGLLIFPHQSNERYSSSIIYSSFSSNPHANVHIYKDILREDQRQSSLLFLQNYFNFSYHISFSS